MTRSFIFIFACLLSGSAFGQSVLVNTRLYPSEILDEGEQLQLDLRNYFQLYSDPGPVATLTIYMPVPDQEKKLVQDGEDLIIAELTGDDDPDPHFMTYQLESGESYTDPYAHVATDFAWASHDIEFNLLASDAPGTVANFMTYAADGAYDNTIVHRNESTGQVFRPGGPASFPVLPIIQAGGWTLTEDPLAAVNLDNVTSYSEMVETLFRPIPANPPIAFEETRKNTKGTISMARTSVLNSATSQFFINLEDNTNAFGSAYSVFGELADPETDQPILDQFANSTVYDLSSTRLNGNPNIFPSLPFSTIPMYTPFWDYKSSYSRFSSISVSAGNPDGITYSWEFVDDDDEVSDEEAANRAAFDIQINGSNLVVQPVDTGVVEIAISGTSGSETRTFNVPLASYNPDAFVKFAGATILQGGQLESPWYGILNAMDYPDIVHANHGEQHVADYGDSTSILMVYDKNLESWLYTTAPRYPYLYAYNLGLWLWYVEETGNGDGASRWFYVFDGDNSRWVREDEI